MGSTGEWPHNWAYDLPGSPYRVTLTTQGDSHNMAITHRETGHTLSQARSPLPWVFGQEATVWYAAEIIQGRRIVNPPTPHKH